MAAPQDKKPLNKSDFVRSFPDTVPAMAIVKAAAEKGIVLTRLHVNNVRFAARKKLAKTSGASSAPVSKATTPKETTSKATTSTSTTERAPSPSMSEGESVLTAAIERIVERTVDELFKRRVGELMGA